MNTGILNYAVGTPVFIYDEATLLRDLHVVQSIADGALCRYLYSPKACSIRGVLKIVAQEVDGFATCSTFEAKVVREIARTEQAIHFRN